MGGGIGWRAKCGVGRVTNQQGSHPCKNSHPQPRLDFGPGWSTTVLGCWRVPCREARPRCGRGEVRGVWRRSGRERLAAPSRASVSSVGGSVIIALHVVRVVCAPTR
eukprot:scaffold3587_cov109-Isochrysis_galbana.AAC.9